MKRKSLIFSVFLTMMFCCISAQNKNSNAPQSILSRSANIKKYYDLKELKELNKGQLIELYTERMKVLVKVLPYIALVKRFGVTMADVGIPMDSQNKKNFENQEAAIEDFLKQTVEFQTKIMPYSDKNNLITAILFYESTLKSWYEIGEANE
ncbi:hypothetical protein [Flavobacterium nackdongense]|uniref:Uncharacterized protein n=1 Tax=Flavobacterium nackdongense TaxID=2547394 RepID=A0A4P6YES4_9FLAO|nr:hypothetical protein [Flavobacterium nackdongense]QBN19227.1 hypothetical protein E1750_10570 [Flavobacterium nackdongense]